MPHMDAFDVLVAISTAIPDTISHDIDEFDMQREHVKMTESLESRRKLNRLRPNSRTALFPGCAFGESSTSCEQLTDRSMDWNGMFVVRKTKLAKPRRRSRTSPREVPMSWADRLTRIDPRERRLLTVFLAVLAVLVLVVVPIVTRRAILSRRGDNELLRKAINDLSESQQAILKGDALRQAILARYARVAPPLGALLDTQARQNGIEIPESQDRPLVPHGKRLTNAHRGFSSEKWGSPALQGLWKVSNGLSTP